MLLLWYAVFFHNEPLSKKLFQEHLQILAGKELKLLLQEMLENVENHKKSSMHGKIMEFEKNPE